MTASLRPQKPAGEGLEAEQTGRGDILGGPILSPLHNIVLFIYHVIHLCIHSLTCSTNILYMPDTAPRPRDKMINKTPAFPTSPQS